MKILIASDIHGSASAAEKLIARFNEGGYDRILLLGDVLYHGPRNELPEGYDCKKTSALLNEYNKVIWCVRGNCDGEVDQMVLEFPILADYALLGLGKHLLFATHGHLFNEDKLPPLQKGDVLLHGHTHLSVLREHEDYIYMNPGSLSLPKEDHPRGYMTLENGIFLWKTLEGEEYRRYLCEK